jgi:mono/diheme cytochrome c family protein
MGTYRVAVVALLAGCAVRPTLEEPACDGGVTDAASGGPSPAPPSPYAGMRNPDPTAGDVALGEQVFARACTPCHAAPELARPFATDYLYWRVSEGGGPPFCSTMPRFRDSMANRDRWRVVAYVASLAPR